MAIPPFKSLKQCKAWQINQLVVISWWYLNGVTDDTDDSKEGVYVEDNVVIKILAGDNKRLEHVSLSNSVSW